MPRGVCVCRGFGGVGPAWVGGPVLSEVPICALGGSWLQESGPAGRFGARRRWTGAGGEPGCQGSEVLAAGRGWDGLGHPEPLSDALVFSQGLEFRKRVEEGAL